MAYAIERIDKLIITTINPGNIASEGLPTTKMKEIKTFVKTEIEEIKDTLKKEFFSFHKEKQIELFVQRYQSAIIHLSDVLLSYQAKVSQQPQKQFYHTLLVEMETLLSFIENYFNKYFDLNAKVSERYKIIVKQELNQKLTELKTNSSYQLINDNLQELLLNFYEEFETHEAYSSLTFRHLIYLKQLLNELLQITKLTPANQVEEEIIMTLYYFNFNHPLFFHFLTLRIAIEVNEIPEALKVEKLYWHIKLINQIQTRPQAILYTKLSGIKQMCTDWLQEEIYYQEKKTYPSLIIPPSQVREADLVETSLSVSQLAFIIKLFYDNGIIKYKSYQQLIQLAAANFKTEKTDRISSESLRIKSLTSDRATVRKVKDIFLDLLNHINSNLRAVVSIAVLNYFFQETISVL